jgi:hypothetical protein
MPNSTQEIITRADLNYNNEKLVDWVRRYVANNKEVIDIESEVLRLLDETNNEVIGNNGVEKAEYTLEQRIALYGILTSYGYNMTNVSFEKSIDLIRKELAGRGAFILDEYGERWTASAWAYEVEMNGKNPATPIGILLVSNTITRLIGLHYTTKQWGTYQHNVPNLSTDISVLGNNDVIADKNTREIIKFANPLLIWDWEESQLIPHDDVRWFDNLDEANADATERYATEPTAIVQTDVYMVGTDRTALATYYWNGTKLTQRLASVPLFDTQKIMGAPAAEYCYLYGKAISVEASGFSWHLPDGREYLQMALHRDIINQCYVALGLPILPTGNVWTCLQTSATTAYYGSGASLPNSNYKGNNCAVVPFAVISI